MRPPDDQGRRLVSFPVPHGFCVLSGHLTRESVEHAIDVLRAQLAAFPEAPANGQAITPSQPGESGLQH